jgi:predicted GIY-YIG superfamily endonuclease
MSADPYRPDLDPSQDGTAGWVYLLHLDPAFKHARHYVGSARDLAARLAEHGTANGARLLEVQREAGGSWHVVRTWPGWKAREREIKDRHDMPRLCPECSSAPQPGRHRERQRQAAPRPRAQPAPRPTPEQRGTRAAEQFLAARAHEDPDRIAAALEYVTGPYRTDGARTEAARIEAEAFITHVSAGIEARARSRTGPGRRARPSTREDAGNDHTA